MGLVHSPNIAQANLQIYVDWGNSKCYTPGANTFLNLVDSSRNNGYLKNNILYSSNNNGILVAGGANGNGNTNAVGDRIDINTSASGVDRFNKTHNFSFCLWVYNRENTNSKQVFSTGSAGAGTGNDDACIWQFKFYQSSVYQFFWWNEGGGSTNIIPTITMVKNSNVWQHIAITYSYNESSNNVVRAYSDGIFYTSTSINSATHDAKDRTAQTNMQYTLAGGYSSSCYTGNTLCNIGNFMLYNKTLSALEVLKNYNAHKKRFV